MSVTIKDVAILANVAPSTVSRVIANNPRISEKTKVRVRQAMADLGYHPNIIARSLANKSTKAIGLVMPSSTDKVFQNPFFPEIIRGISGGAHEKKYSIHMSTGQEEEEIFEAVTHMVGGRLVDGIVLLYSRLDDPVQNYLKNNKFPFIVVGKPHKYEQQITYVDNDNYTASKDATEYLIKNGHQLIAFVGGDPNLVVTADRLLGYQDALKESNLPYHQEYVVHEEFLREGGKEAVNELFSLANPPTALVVTDDVMAFGVLNTLDQMGLVVPDDVSVFSFNNVLLSEISRPPLSSVDINIYRLGYEAAKNLIQKIENPDEPAKRIIIPHELIVRQSIRKK
ncbi:LacI family DNA-binding transcriptional regulator [Litchfieldia salsa]|uniref:DNA-binding transcriptional regulator, LacI/PurR family n=1 Tax=Litchfieldia salsa TaxID=930152 RepID=A0A1H0RYD4_9BACI|nr:LacI family DNA-binding transcriptional regulator [Litchfieldia salsa]SDP34339.1 DNA-binding transcriptional regulator, LacI/PurR family [Litchfieldia salsa]